MVTVSVISVIWMNIHKPTGVTVSVQFGDFGAANTPPSTGKRLTSIAPHQPVRLHKMPLPNIKKQCTAIKRKTGNRCKNPAAWGCKTCRFHGARRPSSIKRGPDHPQFHHGQCTKEARAAYSEASSRLRKLEEMGFECGLLSGYRTPGRKPGAK